MRTADRSPRFCKTCGALGDCGGLCDRCANCWEVEKRLEDYLKSGAGRDFVRKLLERYEGV